MSIFLPYQRATLLIPSGTEDDPERKHLFILLTNPHPDFESNINSSLLVSASSIKTNQFHDPACILYPGDHAFIKVPSYMYYAKTRIVTVDKLMNGVSQGVFIHKDSLEGEIFARVCKGLEDSRFTLPLHLKFYKAATAK